MLSDVPLVRSVFHPSDFSAASENAFAHALAVSLLRKTDLTILHAEEKRKFAAEEWTQFPAVRTILERWGVLEAGKPHSALLKELSIHLRQVNLLSRNPLRTIMDYLVSNPTDLIVLATEGREGLARWMRRSLAEQVARKSKTMTLFVPKAVRGFVSLDDGTISMRNILIPVSDDPNPQAALVMAARAARLADGGTVKISLLRVGGQGSMPAMELPNDPHWTWETIHQQGEIDEEILKAANELTADMIVMVTKGHDGILDALRGSTTEKIVRQAPCPVLAVPDGQ